MSPKSGEPPVLAVGITETWLKSYISDAQISIPGYITVRADRELKIGGGCVLYINNDVPITKQFTWSDRQTSLVTAFSEQKKPVLCLCIPTTGYRCDILWRMFDETPSGDQLDH